VFPFDNGGKLATRDFYKALSEWFDITIVCLSGFINNIMKYNINLTQHLNVISLPLPSEMKTLEKEFQIEYNTNRCEATWIMSIIKGCHNCLEFVNQLREISKKSTIVIAEHVYTYRIAKSITENKKDTVIWYRAQNVEYDYKCATWGIYNVPPAAYNEVFKIEKECCNNSDLILTITENDAKRFCELYDVTNEKILNISAGYDAENIRFILPSERRAKTKNSQISALYISSSAQVAIDAANQIAIVAQDFLDIEFNIAGSVGSKMNTNSLPANVNVLGIVSDNEKVRLLETCDFALNPILGGSGLNIKMLEYFAYGIPVISTEFGARGIEVEDGVNCLLMKKNALQESIQRFSSLSLAERDNIAINAQKMYLSNYTWRSCAEKVISYIKYEEQLPFIPSGNIYVYGAGEWGRACLSFLQSKDIMPVAFLDKDEAKWGKTINDVRIQSLDKEIINNNDCSIIFALAEFMDAVKFFLDKGLKLENIIVGMYGVQLFRLSDGKGCIPYYIDIEKIQSEVGL
jgi:glycosyltransferase involved in cell wall biosynthesis